MNIRKDKSLNILANASGKKATEVELTIVSQLIQKGIIQDEPDYWGYKLLDCIESDVAVTDIVAIINTIGIPVVRSEHVEALLSLILIGNGECPKCGGEMEVIDGEYKCCGGDGYITPLEYMPLWEEKQCFNCGYRI